MCCNIEANAMLLLREPTSVVHQLKAWPRFGFSAQSDSKSTS